MNGGVNKWSKSILGVKTSTPNSAVAGELGQIPLAIFRKVRMIKYWAKIITGPTTRIRYAVYQHLYNCADVQPPLGYANWTCQIRNILVEVGRPDIWQTQTLDRTISSFCQFVQQSLTDIYIVQWKAEMQTKDKLHLYVLYKTVFQFQSYLYLPMSPAVRRSMARFRLSAHGLAVELGRYPPKVVRQHRYCRQCDNRDIEDEFHFMFVCTKHSALRKTYIPSNFWRRPSVFLFIELMSQCDDDPKLCTEVSKFVHSAFKNRLVI